MLRLTLLCTILAAAGCTETTAACPDPSHVRYADGRCGPPTDGGSSGVDAGAAGADAGDGDAGADECGGCATDEICRPDGQCVECIDSMDCAGGEICDISPGACVECVDNTTCPVERPTCDANACTAMCNRPLCSGRFPGTPACHPDTGGCVECDRANEATDCAGNSCDPSARTCTMTPLGSRGLCEPCVSDSECATFDDPRSPGSETIALRCVPTDWEPSGGAPAPAGSYCLPEASDSMLVGADCPPGAPRREGPLTSAGETPVTGTFCLPVAVTTCAALLDTDPCDAMNVDDVCGVTGEADSVCSGGRCRALCSPVEPLGCFTGDTCGPFGDGVRNFCD